MRNSARRNANKICLISALKNVAKSASVNPPKFMNEIVVVVFLTNERTKQICRGKKSLDREKNSVGKI